MPSYTVKKAGWYTDEKGRQGHKNKGTKIDMTEAQAKNLILSEQVELVSPKVQPAPAADQKK
jgi:hypothetical protein